MLFTAEKLSIKHRHGALAVSNLSFSVEKGQILTVLGDTECGKTTLLKAIAGLYKITDGKIFLDGKEANNMPIKDRDVCLMHEDGGFFNRKTVRYNLEYPFKIRGKKANFDQLSFVPADLLDKKINKLSPEEKVAVMMERMRLREARLYLIDDPFKPFDDKKKGELFLKYLPFISSLSQKGGVIYATGRQEEAAHFDSCILLHYGVEQQRGKVIDFATDPNSLCALYYSETEYTSGLTTIEEKSGELSVTCDGENYPLYKERLLNEIYIGSEVIFAKADTNLFLFDKNCEQRIYF